MTSYLWIYVLLPTLAVLMDMLLSYLSLNRMSIYGKATTRPDDEGMREFLFHLQNDESRMFRDPDRPIELVFSSDTQHKLHPWDFEVRCGPGDEFRIAPHTRVRPPSTRSLSDAVVISIPRMRPWKTWTVRCRAENTVHRIRMELHVPKRSILRGLLQKINEHTFMFSDVGYHSETIDVSGEPVLKTTKGGWKGLAHVVLPVLFFCVWFYAVFAGAFLVRYRDFLNAYALRHQLSPADAGGGLLGLSSLWVDGGLFAFGFWAIYMIARMRPVPLAPGYETPRTHGNVDRTGATR